MARIGEQALAQLRELRQALHVARSPSTACRAGGASANPIRARPGPATILKTHTACLRRVLRPRMVAGWRRGGDGESVKPVLGMAVAFRPAVESDLADVPARVVAIWPRLRSGAYLVTLEYAQPIVWHHEVIQQVEALMSELYEPVGR